MGFFSLFRKYYFPIHKDYSINIISQFINITFSILPVLLISNLLGPQAKGTITLFFVIIGYFQVFGGLGISGSAIYFVAKDKKREKFIKGELLYISFILGFISIIFYLPISYFYFSSINEESLLLFLISGSVITFISITNNISQHLFIGSKNFINFSIISNSPLIISSIAITIFIFFYKDVNMVIICYTSSYILSFILSCIIHIIFDTKFKINFNQKIFRNYFIYGFKSYLGRVLWRIWDKVDYLFIVYLLSVSSVGLYSISYMFSETIVLFATTTSSVVTTYVASNKSNKEEKVIFKTLKYILLIMIFYSLILFFISDLLINNLFISEFKESIVPLKILIPGMIFLSTGKILASYLAGIGKPELQSIAIILAFIISLSGNFILIPLLGIIGASIASSISFFVYCLILSYLFLKTSNKSIRNIFFED